jgi:hypothetical protein
VTDTPPPSPLGRRLLHDPRSRDYEYPVRRDARQISVRHRMDAPNLDQFYTSGCVGFSGTNLLNCAAAARSRRAYNLLFPDSRPRTVNRYLDNDDALDNYSASTKHDPFDWVFPPNDEGSSALGLMKHWHKAGIISGYSWAFTFEQFLAALQRQPVLVGTNWYEDMNNPLRTGLVFASGPSVGGHEYLATGIRYDRRWIRFENSWGENWGDRGGFYMHFNSVEQLLAEDGDVAIPRLL